MGYFFAGRIHFSLKFRKEDESNAQFVTTLRGLDGNCEFGDS